MAKVPKANQKPDEAADSIVGKDLRKQILGKGKASPAAATPSQVAEIVIPKIIASDCREAIHWFAGQAAHYKSSARSLLATDFTVEQEAVLESALLNMRARGVNPLILTGEVLFKQAEYLWEFALQNTTFGRPVASKLEIEISGADVLILKDLEAPERFEHLWYLYHYVLYPRALANKPSLITSPLTYEEFVMYGAGCEDLEYAGRKVSWEKLLWLLNNTAIDLYFFRQLKEEGHPIMLQPEYALFKAMRERNLTVMPQHISADSMLDFAMIEKGKEHRLDIECDLFDQLGSSAAEVNQDTRVGAMRAVAKDNWQILRFTYGEILHNPGLCADAAEEVWRHGRKKGLAGRLVTEQAAFVLPELPMSDDTQKLAITHQGGPASITGGAGTGKTTCLIRRIAFLIAQGVNPDRILVISYSQDALSPFKPDLAKLTDKQVSQRVSFYTWHDFGLKILKENLAAIKRKPPLKTEPNGQKILQKLLLRYKKDLDPAQLELSEELDELTIASLISIYKANLISPAYVKERSKSTIDELVAKVYQAYEEQLQKSNRVDRDDMISLAAKLLAEQPDVRKRYQYQFDHILIDEYQDATLACDLLARLLSFPQDNIFIAGDEDESMDESRGALPRLIADVSVRQPNARCYVLENNWRCHPTIVEHARRLLGQLTRRRINKLWHSGWGTTGGAVVTGPHALSGEQEEAEWVAEETQLLLDAGRRPEEIGIFYRYHRFGSIIEEALAHKGIRSITTDADYGVVPDEVADVMAFLRLIMDPDGPKARESFERVCQLRMREVDPKLSIEIAKYAEALNLSYLKAIELYSEAVPEPACKELQQLASVIRRLNQENMPPAENIGFLARTQRLKDFYSSLKVPPGVRYEPLKALKQLEEEARKFKTVTEFVRHQTKQSTDDEESESSVNILTLHEAKGREYNVVFLVGLAEGLFPAETSSDREEERRLFYVGMTRAREQLYLSYPSSFSEVALSPSSFLIESGFSFAKRSGVEVLFPAEAAPVPLQLPVQPLQASPPVAAPQATPQQVVTSPAKPAGAPVAIRQTQSQAPLSSPPIRGAPSQPASAPPPANQPLVARPIAASLPPPKSPGVAPAMTNQQPVQAPVQRQLPPSAQPSVSSSQRTAPLPQMPPSEQVGPKTQSPAHPTQAPSGGQMPVPAQPQRADKIDIPVQASAPIASPILPQASMPPPIPRAAQPAQPSPAMTTTNATLPLACPDCSSLLDAGSKFCSDCGRAVELALPSCHLCGAPLPPSARFCGECGSNLVGHTTIAKVGQAGPVPSPPSTPTSSQQGMAQQMERTRGNSLPASPHSSNSGTPLQQKGWVDNLMKFLEGDGTA